jgi:PPP family 3-phenylpropionic acid transporter
MQSGSLSWVRPLYFVYYAAAAVLSPFLVIYYQELGLKGSQIGVLAGLPALVSGVSGPIWGAFFDRTSRKRLTLLLAIAGAILLGLAISRFNSFTLLIPVVTLFAFFSSTIPPLVDSTTMAELGGQKQKYGQYRMWGAIGWGVFGPIIGWLIEVFSIQASFWTYAVLMAVGFLIALRIPVSGSLGSPSGGVLHQFLADRRWLPFLGFAFASGMVLSIISNFLFIYLRDLGANEFTLGWTLTVATLSEIPVLFFSNHLLKRWSPTQLMLAAIFLFALRSFAYTLIDAPWMALLIQLLHGSTFSLMWIAGVSYADAISPAGLHATAQGLFSGVMMGVGSGVGAFLGGWFYEQAGLVNLFRLAAMIALITGGLMLVLEGGKHARTI